MRKKEIIKVLTKENERLAEKVAELKERNEKLHQEIVDTRFNCCERVNNARKKLSTYILSNEIDRVMVSDGATIVWFKDGQKVVVRKAKNEKGDTYTAVAYAMAKHMFGSNHQFKKEVNRKLPKQEVVRLKKLEEAERLKEKQRKRHIKINIDSVLTEPKKVDGKE